MSDNEQEQHEEPEVDQKLGDVEDPHYEDAESELKFELKVSVVKARNLKTYKIVPHAEEEEPAKKGKKAEEEEEKPIEYSTDPPNTFASYSCLLPSHAYDIQGQISYGSATPEYGWTKLHKLLKTEKCLDFLCSKPLRIEVTEVDDPPEDDNEAIPEPGICAQYFADVDMINLFSQGETKVEGWFPLSRIWPEDQPKKRRKAVTPDEGESTDVTPDPSRPSTVPGTPPLPPEIFISISLSEPLFSDEEFSKIAVCTVSCDKLCGLPGDWIEEFERIEAAKEKRRQEREAAAAKGGKPAGKGKGAKDETGEKSRGKPPDPDADCEKYSYCLAYDLPLTGEDEENNIHHSVETLQMPEVQPLEAVLDVEEDDDDSKPKDKTQEKKEAERKAQLQKEAAERAAGAETARKAARFVPWNFFRRTFLSEAAVKAFHRSVKKALPFQMKVFREHFIPAENSDGRKSKTLAPAAQEDGPSITKGHIGEVSFDLRKLLKEGETSFSSEAAVKMSEDTVEAAKAELETKLAELREEAAQGKKGRNKNGEVDDEILALEQSEPDTFIGANTHLTVTIQLSRPLLPVQLHPKLLPKDIVPPRQPPLVEWPSAESEFSAETVDMLRKLARQFAKTSEQFGWDDTDELALKRKRALLYTVNKTGLYFQMKESLKPSIVRITHDIRKQEAEAAKFGRGQSIPTSGPIPADQLPRLLTALHARLSDHATVALNKYLSNDPSVKVSRFGNSEAGNGSKDNVLKITALGDFTPSELKRLAEEAELCDDFESAADYHNRRVLMREEGTENGLPNPDKWEPDDCPAHWYDFGLFWLRRQNRGEAERCFKEAISVTSNYLPALLAYGSNLLNTGDFERAEVLIRAAVSAHPEHWFTNALQGLYLESCEEEALSQESYAKAFELFDSQFGQGEEKQEGTNEVDAILHDLICNKQSKSTRPGSLYVQLARYLLQVDCAGLADKLLQKDSKANGNSTHLYMAFAQVHQQTKNSAKATDAATAALDMASDHGQVVEAFALMGHVCFENGNIDGAVKLYEQFLDWEPQETDPSLLYRLAQIYLEDRNYSKVKDLGLQLCKAFSCCSSWLSVGLSCLRMNELEEAERALVHANYLDHTRAQVWGLLSVLCLSTDRYEKGSHAFQQACNLQLEDAHTYRNIGAICLEKGLLDLAKMALLRSLSLSVDVETHILLADVFWAQNLYEEQVKHYTLAFEMIEDPDMKREVGSRLCTTLLQLDREDLAQKYQEFMA